MTDAAPAAVPAPHKPLPAIDDNVVLPKAVRDAAARSEAFYKPAEPAPQAATPPAAPAPEPSQPTEPTAQNTPAQPANEPAISAAAPSPQPAPPAQPQPPASADDWEHRYLSMKGRYDQAMRSNGVLQEQLQQMSDELMRMQQALTRPPQPVHQPPQNLVTKEDEENFGPEILDVVQRVAKRAVEPLVQENQELKKQVQRTTNMNIRATLDAEVPNWQEIHRHPNWRRWLSLPDIYAGVVRGKLLNEAVQAANAPRIVAFYKGFLRDEAITGNAPASATPAPVAAAPAAPNQPAVPLQALAAPGRARPASDVQPVAPADKPVFTRDEIKRFYAAVRAGAYSGREAEKNAFEQMLFSAQREGRVR